MVLASAGICITVGAALSLRFNVVALVLAIALASLGIAVMAILHGDPIRSIVLAIISIVLALQAGYLGGVITRIVIASIDIRKSGTKNWAFPSAHPQG